jgi:hypothetical protein
MQNKTVGVLTLNVNTKYISYILLSFKETSLEQQDRQMGSFRYESSTEFEALPLTGLNAC